MFPTKRNIYSQLERNLVRELVSNHKEIVENKQTDKSTVQRKNEAWDVIANDFNAQPGVTERSVESIRKCWENMKCTAKKEVEMIVPDPISGNSTLGWTKRNPTIATNGTKRKPKPVPVPAKRIHAESVQLPETSVDFERIEHDEKISYIKFKTEQKKLVTQQKVAAYKAKQNYYEEKLTKVKKEYTWS